MKRVENAIKKILNVNNGWTGLKKKSEELWRLKIIRRDIKILNQSRTRKKKKEKRSNFSNVNKIIFLIKIPKSERRNNNEWKVK